MFVCPDVRKIDHHKTEPFSSDVFRLLEQLNNKGVYPRRMKSENRSLGINCPA